MERLIAGLAVLLAGVITHGADEPARFAGEWKTTFGPVAIVQEGDSATDTVGPIKDPLKGKVNGKDLSFAADEGQAHVEVSLTLEPSGNAFSGTLQVRNGRRGVWSGWRADPAATQGDPADFAGLGLTERDRFRTRVLN